MAHFPPSPDVFAASRPPRDPLPHSSVRPHPGPWTQPRPQWNELRAALSYENLVGLAYIHDPSRNPRQHLAEAEELRRAVAQSAREALAEWDRTGCGCPPSEAAGQLGGAVHAQHVQQVQQPVTDVSSQPQGPREGQQEQQGQQEQGQGEEEGSPLLNMFVFVLEQENGVNGHLLVEEEGEGRDGGWGHRRRGRAVTLEEYLGSLEAAPRGPVGTAQSAGSGGEQAVSSGLPD
jgi:hypothetical protein